MCDGRGGAVESRIVPGAQVDLAAGVSGGVDGSPSDSLCGTHRASLFFRSEAIIK